MARYRELPAFFCAPRQAARAPAPVLLVNVGRLALHHGAVGIIRSLGRLGVPVYAIVEDRFTPACISCYLAGAILWDTRQLDAHRFLEGMAWIGQKMKRATILIPTGDFAASLIAEHAPTLERWFLVPRQPATLPRTLADKRELYLLCDQMGVAFPRTAFPACMEDVLEFVAQVSFPIVVKAAAAWRLPDGSRTTVIVRSLEELYALCQDTAKNGLWNLLLQEYVDPEHGEDWFYHAYRNAQTNYLVSFTGRKLRSFPSFAGPTTLGKAITNGSLQQRAERLLQALSYSGICDLDFRLDRRSGEYKLLDFNPRIGAQFRLFEDSAGIDVARALYLDLTGKRVSQRGGAQGRTFIAEFHDVAACFGYLRRGKLSLRDWCRTLGGRREFAWLSADDPLPFLVTCTRLLLRVGGRLLATRVASHGVGRLTGAGHNARELDAKKQNSPGFSKLKSPERGTRVGVPQ